MNLIEQFGYEAVKSELKNKKWRKDNLHGSAEFTWHMEQHIQLLEAILLQYRRQHNIFEIGDKVVFLSNIAPEHDGIYTITEVFKNSCFIIKDGMDYRVFYDYIRHATDEEIKAGRRL